MNPLYQLKSVLCDPEGKCCISGSDEDRAIIDRALKALAEPAVEHQVMIDVLNAWANDLERGFQDCISVASLRTIAQTLAEPAVEPACKSPLQVHKPTGWVAHKNQYAVPVLFNPYTGEPRDVRDVQSDPQGVLIVPPGKVEMIAASPPPPADVPMIEPISPEKITDLIRGRCEVMLKDLCLFSFSSGVRWAEKQHGIGGEG